MIFQLIDFINSTSRFRLQTALKTDERVRLMDEIVRGVQVIKLYAWEKPFAKLVHTARKLELKILIKSSYIRAVFMTFGLTTGRICLFFTLLSTVLMGGQITASKVLRSVFQFQVLSQFFSGLRCNGLFQYHGRSFRTILCTSDCRVI